MSSQENFRANIRAAIKSRGITQRIVAERAETSAAYVNRVISGEISPSLETCDRLARALGLPLVALIIHPSDFGCATLENNPEITPKIDELAARLEAIGVIPKLSTPQPKQDSH